jgi:hypothetical protein
MSAMTVAGAGVGALAYGGYNFNKDGYVDKAKGVGEGAIGIGLGIGAYKIARGGTKTVDRAKYARAISNSSSALSSALKRGAGLSYGTAAAAGVYAYSQFQDDHYKNATIGGGVALAAGALGTKMLIKGNNAAAVSSGIDKALSASRHFAAKAARLEKPKNFGTGALVGGIALGAGSVIEGVRGDIDAKTAAKGVAIGGVTAIGGGMLRSNMARRMAGHSMNAEKMLESAYQTARTAVSTGRSSRRTATIAKDVEKIAADVTKLRMGGMGTGQKVILGGILAGSAVLSGIMGSKLGLF